MVFDVTLIDVWKTWDDFDTGSFLRGEFEASGRVTGGPPPQKHRNPVVGPPMSSPKPKFRAQVLDPISDESTGVAGAGDEG